MTAPDEGHRPRSTFVTVVAWVFIIFSGFATFMSLLQNVMVSFMPPDILNLPGRDTTFAHVMPSSGRFMMTHIRLFVLVVLVMCMLTLTASIGLLQRRNWGRLMFIGVLSFGIVYNLASLVWQQSMMSSFTSQFPIDSVFKGDSGFTADSAFRATGQQFDQMMSAIRSTILVMAIAFSALFGWIIVKLVSRPIREEFGVVSDTG